MERSAGVRHGMLFLLITTGLGADEEASKIAWSLTHKWNKRPLEDGSEATAAIKEWKTRQILMFAIWDGDHLR